MTTPTTPAGWYADPSDPTRHRYFDGQNWTAYVSSNGAQASAPYPTGAPYMAPSSVTTGRSNRTKIIWFTTAGAAVAIAVGAIAANAGSGGGSGGTGGGSGGTGGSGAGGATASSFATPTDSLCASIGSGWSSATRVVDGGTNCTLDLDSSGDTLDAVVTRLHAGGKDSFNGTSPSVDELIKQDEQYLGVGWSETFTVPGYALAGVDTEIMGSADAYAYASDGTRLNCSASDLGNTTRQAFISRCEAVYKVLARH